MKAIAAIGFALILALLSGCTSDEQKPQGWVDDDVTFVADGLTIHGTYRHERDAAPRRVQSQSVCHRAGRDARHPRTPPLSGRKDSGAR